MWRPSTCRKGYSFSPHNAQSRNSDESFDACVNAGRSADAFKCDRIVNRFVAHFVMIAPATSRVSVEEGPSSTVPSTARTGTTGSTAVDDQTLARSLAVASEHQSRFSTSDTSDAKLAGAAELPSFLSRRATFVAAMSTCVEGRRAGGGYCRLNPFGTALRYNHIHLCMPACTASFTIADQLITPGTLADALPTGYEFSKCSIQFVCAFTPMRIFQTRAKCRVNQSARNLERFVCLLPLVGRLPVFVFLRR